MIQASVSPKNKESRHRKHDSSLGTLAQICWLSLIKMTMIGLYANLLFLYSFMTSTYKYDKYETTWWQSGYHEFDKAGKWLLLQEVSYKEVYSFNNFNHTIKLAVNRIHSCLFHSIYCKECETFIILTHLSSHPQWQTIVKSIANLLIHRFSNSIFVWICWVIKCFEKNMIK